MSFLERNLNQLRKTQSGLADRLAEIVVPADRYQVIETQIPTPTVEVSGLLGRKRLLGSRHNPWKEACRWAESHREENIFNLCFFGGGLWYHVMALVQESQQTVQDVIVIDHDPLLARLTLELVDLTQLLGNEHLLWFVEPEEEDLQRTLNDMMTGFALDGLKCVEHEPTVSLQPDAYAESKKTVEDSMRGGRMLLRTKTVMGGLIQANVLRNLPDLFTHPGASLLMEQFSNVPAFIVGAGPSLDKNVNDLAAVGDRGVIFTVDTSYPILRSRGIQAHVNVTCDPTALNLAHFEQVMDHGETLLVFSPTVRPEIVQKVEARKASLPLPTSRTVLRLKNALGLPIYMKPGLMVSQAAFNLAALWGCNPIVLVGMDLSFAPEGGATHARGAALKRKIRSLPDSPRMRVELLNANEEDEFTPIFVEANDGGELPTSEFWYAYLRSLEGDIRVFDGRVINATAGGALIKGAEYRQLADTIDEVCREPVAPSERIARAFELFIEPDREVLSEFLEECVTLMNDAVEGCRKGLAAVDELEKALQDVSAAGRAHIERLLDRVHDAHKETIQERRIYRVLDDAADHILQPFMQRINRPIGDPMLISNLNKSVDRFRGYFTKMERLCVDTLAAVTETQKRNNELASTQRPSMDDFFFNL